MKILVLGTRGEIEESSPYHSKKSGVLINDTLLLDIGDKRFLDYHPKYILITHLHPDHAYFVRHHEKPDTALAIYAPESYDLYPIHITSQSFTLDGYTITPIPTIHSVKVKSNAYLIEYKDKRILYTGDMIWIEKKYWKLLGKLDLIVTEGSFFRKGGIVRRNKTTGQIYGHTGTPNLVKFFSNYTHTMLLVHFGAWFYKDMQEARKQIQKLGDEYNVEIIVGYDGLEIILE
jgi:ribonuclease BN (tRNA processing enzyme)